MLFLFPDVQERAFWMRGMRFPIDIAYLYRGQVMTTWPHAKPEAVSVPKDKARRYPSGYMVDGALEVPAGWLGSHGIGPGDIVRAGRRREVRP